MPRAIASAGLRKRTSRPSTSSRPSSKRSAPAIDARELGSSGAKQAGDAEHFAGVQREADVREHAADVEPFDAQQLGAARDAHLRKVLAQIAVRHQPHQLRHGHLIDRPRRHVPRRRACTVMRRPMRNTSSSRCVM